MIRKPDDLPEDDDKLDRWLLTYSDLITLLLALFVVLYSMTKVDLEKFNHVRNEFALIFQESAQKEIDLKPSDETSAKLPITFPVMEAAAKEIVKAAKRIAPDQDIDLVYGKKGLSIRIPDSLLFSSGSIELSNNAKSFLNQIAPALLESDKAITIEGHTDNTPIANEMFPSNWELSVRRSVSVVRYLTEFAKMPSAQIEAAGFGEFKPVMTNETAEGRQKNRRVEIVLQFDENDMAKLYESTKKGSPKLPPGWTIPLDVPLN